MDCSNKTRTELQKKISELSQKISDLTVEIYCSEVRKEELKAEREELEQELKNLPYHRTHKWVGVHAWPGSARINLALGCYCGPGVGGDEKEEYLYQWIKNWDGENHSVLGDEDGPPTLSLELEDMRVLIEILEEAIDAAKSSKDQ